MTHEREKKDAVLQYYDPAKWQRILERLTELFLTGQVFSLNAGFMSECCGKQSSYIIQERPRRVVQTCCHAQRRVESLVVKCLEICAVSGQQYPSILTFEVEGCINAAPARQHRLLVSLRDDPEEDTDPDEDTKDSQDSCILQYAPDSLITWLEGSGDATATAPATAPPTPIHY